MAKFMIELPHTDAECLQALDEIREHGSSLLPNVSWGCMAGVHNGWVVVDAKNEDEARRLPASPLLRGKTKVTPVSSFTAADIESFHKMKK